MSTAFRDEIQRSLGDAYAIERELGGGGMSRVFVAEERRLGRRVVVKVLNPELAADVSAERFEREMRLAAQLQDPHIVPVLNAGEAAGIPYYTMPFVVGESLRTRMAQGRLPLPDALQVLRDVAAALEHAHTRQVVHRDIKPENVLLAGRSAMVTDFGIAKALVASTQGRAARQGLTQAGMAVGTPAYMAPEQIAGEHVDQRADLYAWGVMAHEMLAGRHPFGESSTPQALMAAHLSESPPPLRPVRPDVPESIVALVERCMAKEPSHRPASAAELLAVLGVAPSPPGGEVPRALGSERAARIFAASVAVVALLVAGALVARWARNDSAGAREAGRAAVASESAVPRSVAVLPFENVGGDSADAYFADGIAEELMTTLGRVPGLRLASRGASFRYRERVEPQRVGRELKVQAVLTGTVRRSGDRLRVAAELADARDGSVLWNASFERTATDLFAVQDELSASILGSLREKFGVAAAASIASEARGTDDLEAYDLYLKGRFAFAKRGESLRDALRYFNAAVARDPGFARAHAGLAMAYVVLPMWADLGDTVSFAQAMTSANRAIALDSTVADGYLARAYAHKFAWRWEPAEADFRRAMTLAPDDPTAHHWYGNFLAAVGRAEEAVLEDVRALALDPMSHAITSDLTNALYAARRYDEARLNANRGIMLDSTAVWSYIVAGMIQLAAGQPDSALASLTTARRFSVDGYDLGRPHRVAALQALARSAEARALYDAVRRDHAAGREADFGLAVAAAGIGDRESALAALERAFAARAPLVTEFSVPCDPLFDPIRDDARFRSMIERAGMRLCAIPVR